LGGGVSLRAFSSSAAVESSVKAELRESLDAVVSAATVPGGDGVGSAGGGRDVDDRCRTGSGGVAVPPELGRGELTAGGGGRLGGAGSTTGGAARGARPGKKPLI